MLGGRVKTLHPRIHGGILARRDRDDDLADARRAGHRAVRPRLRQPLPVLGGRAAARRREEEAVEMIDVGGPSMLRAAAKNFAHVAPVCRPDRYGFVLDELRANGELSLETRRELAAEAFATTAAYEAAIAAWFARASRRSPRRFVPALREGARPLVRREPAPARGVLRRGRARGAHLLSRVEQLHGKELSFNNLNDLSAARLARARVRGARLRDREAREPVRRRDRRDGRRGVRARARLRSRRPRTAASSS